MSEPGLLRALLGPLVGVWLVACAAGGPGSLPDEARPGSARDDSSGLDFSLRDLKGRTQTLSALRGKVVLVSFWATWCEPCQTELAELQAMWRELGPRGFELVSVCVDPADGEGQVRKLVRRYRYEFPVWLDQDARVSERFNPTLDLPFGLILDRQGRIQARHQGYRPGDEQAIRRKIEELLTR